MVLAQAFCNFAPSWSPDGNRIVYGRAIAVPGDPPRNLWSRNPRFELISTDALPAYNATGERYLATVLAANRRDSTLMVREGDKPAKKLLESKDELILAPQWSPRGDAIVFGIGKFAAFLDFAIGAKKPVDPVNGGAWRRAGQAVPVKERQPDGQGQVIDRHKHGDAWTER